MAEELLDTSLTEISERLRRREVEPLELLRAVLARIERWDAALGAMITVTAERALAAAAEAGKEIAAGRWRGPLHGVPFTVKDLFDARGSPTTAASRFLQGAAPSRRDASVVERLEAAGAVLVGKTNLHEFAYGSTGESSVFGAVHNPWDPTRMAGGSSGGSAAAVAAGFGLASLGTDTGGSTRIPAALCGVVGLKPTFGRVSRCGLLPLAPSLDHVGALARSALDVAHLLRVLAGPDPGDPHAAQRPVPDFAASLQGDLRGLRVGVLAPTPGEASPGAAAALTAALDVLADAGARVTPLDLPTRAETRQAAYVVLFAESARTHAARMAGSPERFFPDLRARFERGAKLSAVEYLAALETRERVRAALAEVFERLDLLASPMVPVGAPPLGAPAVLLGGREIPVGDVTTTHTREWNLLGNPALSLPAGFDEDGLPLAIQFVGRHWEESTILRAADAFQRRTRWHLRRPRPSEARA